MYISKHVIELFTLDGRMCAAYILYKRPVYICMMCKLIYLFISIHIIELFTLDGRMCAAYILYKRPVYICLMCKLISYVHINTCY